MVKNNNKTHFFYVLYSDKTWVFDQSEHTQGPIYNYKHQQFTKLLTNIIPTVPTHMNYDKKYPSHSFRTISHDPRLLVQ